MRDIDGNEIVLGSKVKVLVLDPRIVEFMDDEDRRSLENIVAGPMVVYELCAGHVNVEGVREVEEGAESHAFSVLPSNVRVVG
ncbi:hypothetical protein [Pseudoxanthomonas sp. PXM02]|uniref:hypothetical protein n=1 Tax=Pseudoxanthomonas sp. PXM02 TaxID=2769294 RepID=UPI001786E2DB|nr:hypothetical protein [Pseudoxanthomonas sp. PXM02]MBD9481017.1 hypothetical protein [Pseudoxanthomonas sp. PXM02]